MTVNQAFLRLVFFRSLFVCGFVAWLQLDLFISMLRPGDFGQALPFFSVFFISGFLLLSAMMLRSQWIFEKLRCGGNLTIAGHFKRVWRVSGWTNLEHGLVLAFGLNCFAGGMLLKDDHWLLGFVAFFVGLNSLSLPDWFRLPEHPPRLIRRTVIAVLLPLLLLPAVDGIIRLENLHLQAINRDLSTRFASPEVLRQIYGEVTPNAAPVYRQMLACQVQLPPEMEPFDDSPFPVRNPPQTELRKYLAANSRYIELLDQVTGIEKSHFGRQYDQLEVSNDILMALRQAIRCTGYREVADPAAAPWLWLASAAYVWHCEDGVNLISFLVSSGMEILRLEQLEQHVLLEGAPKPEMLRAIILQLEDQEQFFRQFVGDALRGEMTQFNAAIQKDMSKLSLNEDAADIRFPLGQLQVELSHQACAEFTSRMIAVIEKSVYQPLAVRQAFSEIPLGAITGKMFTQTMESIPERYFSLVARLRCARIALALELYREEHGRYPTKLAELAPKYLAQVPLNPFDGKEPVWNIAETDITFADGAQVPQDGQYPTVTEKRLMLTVAAPGGPGDRVPAFTIPAWSETIK